MAQKQNLEVKRKVIIDLDVITIGTWDRSENADYSRKFMSKVENQEFYVITPTSLLELVRKWEHQNLKIHIEEFYIKNSNETVERVQIIKEILSKGIDFEKIFQKFIKLGIKEEDITLILVSSLRSALLITFNGTHLKNKEEEINGVLFEYSLKTIEIISPKQI